MKSFRRTALCAAFAVLLLAPSAVLAQAYPAKSVRVVVVFPPGGSNDVVARIVFQKMSENMGQQFVIDNRGGASGTIGADLVAKSPGDGYTLMVQSATHMANAHLYKNLPYDTLGDFIGVTTMARQVAILVVHPSMPVKTTRDFIALAKKRPGEIVYGSAGSGSLLHLAMGLLNHMTGTKMIHVPYKGGGPVNIAIASGEIQAVVATIASVIPNMKGGRVRPIAVTSEKRTTQFPDIPALAEAIPGYEFTAWVAAFAPKGTPRPVIDRLNAELKKVLEHPDVAKNLSSQTLDPMHMTPDQFAQRLKADYTKYADVIKLTAAKID